MLQLYTSGYGFSQRRLEDTVTWFFNKYLPKHHITLEVLHRGLKRENVMGWCDVYGRTHNPREFLIELQSGMNKEDYLITLLHELYHLHQFVKGDLKLKSSKKYYKGICMEDVDYEDQEHEKEAYKMEKILYQEYMIFLRA